jgi:hypothetical protein
LAELPRVVLLLGRLLSRTWLVQVLSFLGGFRSRQGCFQFVWFNIIGVFGLRIGFYGRASKASWSARKLYAARFAFYSQ